MNVSLNAYVLFGLLEGLIVLLVVGAGGIFKWRTTQRTVDTLRAELRQLKSELKRTVAEHKNKPAEVAREYGDFLSEQLAKSSVLLGEHSQLEPEKTSDDPAELARQMLAARHQFLQLELEVQAAATGHDVEAQRQAVIQGMQALLAGLSVHPAAQPGGASDESNTAAASRQRSEEIKLREQVEHLRTVVGNQHDVMRELRQLLESSDDDSEELQAALRKLNDAESQGIELQRCLDVMEHENERIKQAGKSVGGVRKDLASPDGDMLRDLVGNQQRTIGKLQSMLRTMTPESGKSKEFEEVINKIQRTNNDLNSCVMVLEDENNHLRDKVDTLQERITNLQGHVDVDNKSEHEATAAPAMVLEITSGPVAFDAEDKLTSEAPEAVATEAAPEPANSVDDEEFDVDALLASAAPVAKPSVTDPVDSDLDVDALLDAAAGDKKVTTAAPVAASDAEAEPTTDASTETDPAQALSVDSDDIDVDALLDEAASRTESPVSTEAEAASEQAEIEQNNPSPTTQLDEVGTEGMEETAVTTPQVAPPIDGDQSEATPGTAQPPSQPPSQAQGEAEEDDIDALLADLFANDNQAESGSKS